jgi:hypothetical protein
MNDCFWFAISACNTERCECKHYLSRNSIEGTVLENKYQNEIDIAIMPVTAKWLDTFEKL